MDEWLRVGSSLKPLPEHDALFLVGLDLFRNFAALGGQHCLTTSGRGGDPLDVGLALPCAIGTSVVFQFLRHLEKCEVD